MNKENLQSVTDALEAAHYLISDEYQSLADDELIPIIHKPLL